MIIVSIWDAAIQDSWNGLFLRSLVLACYINDILTVSPCFSAGTDTYMWMLEPSGRFSIKSGYGSTGATHFVFPLIFFNLAIFPSSYCDLLWDPIIPIIIILYLCGNLITTFWQ